MVQTMNDPRYVLLTECGQIACILGRTAPSAGDVTQAAATMAAAGVAGWVALASGSFYARRRPSLAMVQPVNNPSVPFAAAAAVRGRPAAIGRETVA
jgi:hypothetical protein